MDWLLFIAVMTKYGLLSVAGYYLFKAFLPLSQVLLQIDLDQISRLRYLAKNLLGQRL
jgi:hypothetical protein